MKALEFAELVCGRCFGKSAALLEIARKAAKGGRVAFIASRQGSTTVAREVADWERKRGRAGP